MLNQSKRLNRAVFDKKPVRRARFEYGSIAFFDHQPGAAVVVSKKVAKTAVLRNKIRRRVAHALKKVLPKHDALVIYPTRDAATVPFTDLEAALAVALKSR